MRSLQIFSVHTTRNTMQIDVSAALASRTIISLSAYFRLPYPNTSSSSFRFRWSALSCCL